MKTKLINLSDHLALLAKAEVRKMGYQKMNTSAIWFSNAKQLHDIEIIEMAIGRIKNKCRVICMDILTTI